MRIERHESETASWIVARRPAAPALRRYLLAEPEGWAQTRGHGLTELREVPFPGVPLILNIGPPWAVASAPNASSADGRYDSFLAGLHTRPAFVHGSHDWACIELRLTPLGTHRLLGIPMHELANRTVELTDVLPGADELSARVRAEDSWDQRFDLLERFLLRRLADSPAPSPAVEWSWAHLRRTGGTASIRALTDEVGWSPGRLIMRFREQIGVTPKTLARMIRFDRAVTTLRAYPAQGLAEIAFSCGYFDQPHMNREFRELAGITPTAFIDATLESGGVAA